MRHTLCASVLMGVALLLVPEIAASLGGSNHPAESWRHSESVAFADAQASGRHVVVVFGADWCVPCEKIEQIMNDEIVLSQLSEDFVPLHFDLTDLSDDDEMLQAKYRASKLPAVIFLDAGGQELGRWDRTVLSAADFLAAVRSIVASHPRAIP